MELSPDGKTLAAIVGHRIGLWEIATGKEHPTPAGASGAVSHLTVASDGRTVATAGADGLIRLWDATTQEERKQLVKSEEQSQRAVRCVLKSAWFKGLEFSADGKAILAYDNSGMAPALWEVASGRLLRQEKEPEDCDSAIAPDGRTVARQFRDGTVSLRDMATGKQQGRLHQPGFDEGYAYGATAFAPDCRRFVMVACRPRRDLFTSEEFTVWQWDLLTSRALPAFAAVHERLHAVAFSPDGRIMAGLSAKETPAGRGAEGPIYLWETTTGKLCRTLTQPVNPLCFLAFCPDGRRLVTGSEDGFIRVVDLATETLVGQLEGHRGSVTALRFSPDGKTLFSASADSTVLLWDMTQLLSKEAAPEWSPAELNDCWTDLADTDPGKAYSALRKLVSAPKQGVPLLGGKLKPIASPQAQQVRDWIADLGSDDYETREIATRELARLGETAEPALSNAVIGNVPLETHRRLEALLKPLQRIPPPEALRLMRAVQVLELIGNEEARAVLQSLAKGAAGARQTCDAQESLVRLQKREPK